MPSVFKFAPLFFHQQGPQRLQRRAEPAQLTDDHRNVAQYDCVMGTKLVLGYAAAIDTIYRACDVSATRLAADLACGPGHFTICLARCLKFARVIGIDLSEPMIDVARRNAIREGLSEEVEFCLGDVTTLDHFGNRELDLVTFCDAAHHMPTLETVAQVLHEMDRVTRPEGLLLVMDLARLRTDDLTERYVNLLGHDYVARGLPQFFEDFRNSMYAAWTVKELKDAVPKNTARHWCHIVPRGLPSMQFILGLPVGRKKPFVRQGFPWNSKNHIVPEDMRAEWNLLRMTLALGRRTLVRPSVP